METTEVESKYICPVCCDILKLPVMTPCGHIFCTECLHQCIQRANLCPICRTTIEWEKCMKYTKLEKEINSIEIKCKYCTKKVPLVLFSAHTMSCTKIPPREIPVQQTERIPDQGPNRSTFSCPICHLANLDCTGLREHCNTNHSSIKSQVVCPVCVSMPWGNPDQVSSDFITHLNLRHKFDYDTFVDYQQEEDLALEAALKASLMNN